MPRDLETIVQDAATIGVAFDSVRDFAIACASEFFPSDDAMVVGQFIVEAGSKALAKRRHKMSRFTFVAENIMDGLFNPTGFRSARRCLLFLADQADAAIAESQSNNQEDSNED